MITINLLPQEYRAIARRRRIITLCVLAGAVAGILMIFFLVGRITYASRLEKRSRDLNQKLAQLQTVVNEIKQIEAARSELQNRVSLIQSLDQKRLVYPVLFDDFLTLMPAGVWITSFQTAPHGNGLTITLQAKANSNFAIANWISNLETSHYFQSPQIGPISYGDSTASFTLTCEYARAAVRG
jgi:type IV pilus assembly protein PilN